METKTSIVSTGQSSALLQSGQLVMCSDYSFSGGGGWGSDVQGFGFVTLAVAIGIGVYPYRVRNLKG